MTPTRTPEIHWPDDVVEALKPFAAIASNYDDVLDPDERSVGFVRLGLCRKARAALSAASVALPREHGELIERLDRAIVYEGGAGTDLGSLAATALAAHAAREARLRAEIERLRAALAKPIDMQDVRLGVGEGKLTSADVLAGANAELRRRAALATPGTPSRLLAEHKRAVDDFTDKRLAEGGNPYATPPSQPAREHQGDDTPSEAGDGRSKEQARLESESLAFHEWWQAEQECPEHSLRTKNAANAAWHERARRASPIQPGAGTGWRLVPVHPTPAMKAAGAAVNSQGWDFAHETWAAMLAAAPLPEGDDRHG